MAKTSLRQEKPVTETDIYVKAKRLYREFAERTVAINTRHRARVLTAENSLLDVIGSFSVAYSAIDRETKYEKVTYVNEIKDYLLYRTCGSNVKTHTSMTKSVNRKTKKSNTGWSASVDDEIPDLRYKLKTQETHG